MSFTILLGMDDETADIFRPGLIKYSSSLEVIEKNVSIFHNAKQAIKLINPLPDIFLVSANHIRFDSNKYQEELLKGLLDIKMDEITSEVRLAVQIDAEPKDPFLRSLALIQIQDIFCGTDQNPAGFNMAKLAKQLSVKANIRNIQSFLTFRGLKIGSQLPQDDILMGRIKQLEKIVKILTKEKNFLQSKLDINSIPQKNYDEILAKFREIKNCKITDQAIKDLFEKLVKISQNKQDDLDHISALNTKLNNSIIDLNSEIEQLETNMQEKQGQEKNILNNQRISKTMVIPQRKKIKKSKWFLLIPAVLILTPGPVLLNKIYSDLNQRQQKSEKPIFSRLISLGNYEKAAQYYPQKIIKIEDLMLKDKRIQDKYKMIQKILKYSKNDVIRLDYEYFQGNYRGAVHIYEKSSIPQLTKLTNTRRIMVAYSLMKTGSIKEAKDIAEPLNNQQLNKRIIAYSKFLNANKILNNKIRNGDLTQKEKTKAKQQIKKNQKAMEKI